MAFGQETTDSSSVETVYVFEIKGDIDPRMNRRVKLALEEANQQNADMVLIHMDTYGGAVNDADDIRILLIGFLQCKFYPSVHPGIYIPF